MLNKIIVSLIFFFTTISQAFGIGGPRLPIFIPPAEPCIAAENCVPCELMGIILEIAYSSCMLGDLAACYMCRAYGLLFNTELCDGNQPIDPDGSILTPLDLYHACGHALRNPHPNAPNLPQFEPDRPMAVLP